MNRIKISPLASTPIQSSSKDVVEQQHNTATSLLDPFQNPGLTANPQMSVYVPMHYEKGYSYPLIVWLHSDGDDCGQLQRVMPQFSLRNYVGVAPESNEGNTAKGYYWFQELDCVETTYESVSAAIDHALFKFNIDSQRIYLAGHGSGGTMAFRMAFERPDLFAGVISVNGSLPEGNCPLSLLEQCRDVPVFWAHCRHSAEFDQDDLCAQLKLLHVGGFSVTVRQYPCGDSLLPHILEDADRWIMEMIDSSIL
ncbi:MAG: PHB depolymerase family esterase [Planctomycetota bacterium]